MQTDVVMARLPPGAEIKPQTKTESPAGMDGRGQYLGANPTTQIAAVVKTDKFRSLLTLIRSRPATMPPPKVQPIAEGRGFMIKTDTGRDYVFLGEQPTTFTDDNVSFSGTAGLVRVLNGKTTAALAAPGKAIVDGEQTARK